MRIQALEKQVKQLESDNQLLKKRRLFLLWECTTAKNSGKTEKECDNT